MTATFATDLLGKLVSVYERHYTYEGERWLCTGWVRSAEIGDGSIALVLEKITDEHVDDVRSGHAVKAGDLWAISSKNHQGPVRFSLNDHPPHVGWSDAVRGTRHHDEWPCETCGRTRLYHHDRDGGQRHAYRPCLHEGPCNHPPVTP